MIPSLKQNQWKHNLNSGWRRELAAEENWPCTSENTFLDDTFTKTFAFISSHFKVVGNTTRLMNPTSGGRSSESEVLSTYLGMLDCDTVTRLFDRWASWLSNIHSLWKPPTRYYADFVLFNYSLEEVLTLANNAPCTNLARWCKIWCWMIHSGLCSMLSSFRCASISASWLTV